MHVERRGTMAKTSPTKELIAPAEDPDPLGTEPSEEPPSLSSAGGKVLHVKEHLKREFSGLIPISERSLAFLQDNFPKASISDWSNWQWQLRNSIYTASQLQGIIRLSYDEIKAMCRACTGLPLRITPYYASLMEKEDPSQPIRRSIVPVDDEFLVSPGEAKDPLEEENQSPVPGLVHRYPDRVLFLTTGFCSTYCRYCTRSRIVGNTNKFRVSIKRWDEAIAYIEATPNVRDVLLSGGDPLTLLDSHLDYLLSKIKAIPHVEMVRIGTKVPVVLPQRITPRLLKMLKRYQPLWISIHFTHPDELTPETSAACNFLADAGIPMGSQTVLLKGINDNVQTLRKLFQGLLKIRVRPYYLYQCDPILGSAHFRTSVQKGIAMIEGLRGHTTGYAVPHYVIDAPGGGGKIPLVPEYYLGKVDGGVILRNYAGKTFRYPDYTDA
jgi:lysine 2,3-aminomutase